MTNLNYTLLFLFLIFLQIIPSVQQQQDDSIPVLVAELTPLGNSGVSGIVAVFSNANNIGVGYTGKLSGLEANLVAAECTETNGCGVHIHAGSGCESDLQGGHYYVDPITTDPWLEKRYSSDSSGNAIFGDFIGIGTNEIEGHPFIVHNEAGGRVACGILRAVTDPELYHVVSTTPFGSGGSSVEGTVAIYSDGAGTSMIVGVAEGLEPNLLSISLGGDDCTDDYECGVNIHSAFSCVQEDLMLGVLYDRSTIDSDPWVAVGYPSTTENGIAIFAHTVDHGESDIDGRTFTIKSNDGSIVSCGIIGDEQPPQGPMPLPATTNNMILGIMQQMLELMMDMVAFLPNMLGLMGTLFGGN